MYETSVYDSLIYETVYLISDITLHLRWYFAGSCYKVSSFDQINYQILATKF